MMNTQKMQDKMTGFLFLLPTLLVLSGLLLYPVFSSIYFSFTSKHLIRLKYDFIGFGNFIKILTDVDFYRAFFTSFVWTVSSLVGQVVVGFTAALALHRIKRWKTFFRTMLIIPWAFPSIVIASVWKWILNGVYGFIPNMLVRLGICLETPHFFSDPNLVFGTLLFINIWFGAPLIMVNVLSALQTVPAEQYEAAKIDGASSFQSFLFITLPHIKVVVGLLVVLRTIWIFNNFDLIYLLTGGGPADLTRTLPIYAYSMGWGLKQLGRSSAVTVLLLIFLIGVCLAYFKLLNTWEKENEA